MKIDYAHIDYVLVVNGEETIANRITVTGLPALPKAMELIEKQIREALEQ